MSTLPTFAESAVQILTALRNPVHATAVAGVADVVLDAFESPQGLLALLKEDGSLDCTIINRGHPEDLLHCRIPRHDWHADWQSLMDSGKSLLNNNSHAIPGPLGVRRSMAAVLHDGDAPRGALVVAGRLDEYTDDDLQELETYARLIAPLPGLFTRHADSLQALNGALNGADTSAKQTSSEDLIELYRQAQAEINTLNNTFHKQLTLTAESHLDFANLQQLHESILNNSPSCIYVKGIDGRYEFINRKFEELFHIERKDIIGKTDLDIFPGPMAEAFRENDTLVATTGKVLKIEEIAPQDDGPHTYFSVKFPIFDIHGQVRFVAGISTDITDFVRTKQQAESLGRRLALLLDSVADGVIGLDRDGRLSFMNPAAEAMLAWSERELLGRTITFIFDDEHAPRNQRQNRECPIHAALREGVVFLSEDEYFKAKCGRRIPVEYVVTPIKDADAISGVVISFRDISERLERGFHHGSVQRPTRSCKRSRRFRRTCSRIVHRSSRVSISGAASGQRIWSRVTSSITPKLRMVRYSSPWEMSVGTTWLLQSR